MCQAAQGSGAKSSKIPLHGLYSCKRVCREAGNKPQTVNKVTSSNYSVRKTKQKCHRMIPEGRFLE